MRTEKLNIENQSKFYECLETKIIKNKLLVKWRLKIKYQLFPHIEAVEFLGTIN